MCLCSISQPRQPKAQCCTYVETHAFNFMYGSFVPVCQLEAISSSAKPAAAKSNKRRPSVAQEGSHHHLLYKLADGRRPTATAVPNGSNVDAAPSKVAARDKSAAVPMYSSSAFDFRTAKKPQLTAALKGLSLWEPLCRREKTSAPKIDAICED